jgi:hypothetical protein
MASEDATEGCVVFVLGWLLGWGTGAVRAAVAMKGWEWFFADTFGAPALGFVEAWGFFLLVTWVTMQLPTGQDKRRPAEIMVSSLAASLAMSGLVFVSFVILAGFR